MSECSGYTNLTDIKELAQKHRQTWRDKPEDYWLARLMQEVGELASSLVWDHEDPPEHELRQIAAICLNWLEMRTSKRLENHECPGCGATVSEEGEICQHCLDATLAVVLAGESEQENKNGEKDNDNTG